MGIQVLRFSANKPKLGAAPVGAAAPEQEPEPEPEPEAAPAPAPERPRVRVTFSTRSGEDPTLGPPGGRRKHKSFNFHRRGPMLTRCYKVFGLRHGTMMIALHDLMWSVFIVFLLVLAAAHLREVSSMVQGDIIAHLAERQRMALNPARPATPDEVERFRNNHRIGLGGIGLIPTSAEHMRPEYLVTERPKPVQPVERLGKENATGCCGDLTPATSSYYMRYVEFAYKQAKTIINVERATNDIRFADGLHFATMLSVIMVVGICMAGIDMIASMMLMAGAMLHVRQLMMPWLSLRMLELIFIGGATFVSLFFWAKGFLFCKVILVDCILFFVVFYHWLVAFSLHEYLCRIERCSLIHTTRPSTATATATSAINVPVGAARTPTPVQSSYPCRCLSLNKPKIHPNTLRCLRNSRLVKWQSSVMVPVLGMLGNNDKEFLVQGVPGRAPGGAPGVPKVPAMNKQQDHVTDTAQQDAPQGVDKADSPSV